jgi:hypothetical protein
MLHCRLNPREDEIGNLQIAFILHDHVIVPSVRCELERLSEISGPQSRPRTLAVSGVEGQVSLQARPV